jgi:hypothetical protein
MNYQELSTAANNVIAEIDGNKLRFINKKTKESIKSQMTFIKSHADQKIDPRSQLNGSKFTYGIISFREFSSPEELEVKELLDNVSRIFDSAL